MATKKKAAKSSRGGSRETAGRRQKYKEATTVFWKRVPKSQKSAITKLVDDHLKPFLKPKPI